MDSSCLHCSKPLKTIEIVQCHGFCGQSAHIKCVGLTRPNVELISEHENVFWLCDPCISQLEYIKQNPLKTAKEVVEAVSDVFRESLDELKVEVHETKELAKSLISKRESNDHPAQERIRTAWPSIKRTRDSVVKDTPKSRPNHKLIRGTKSVDKGSSTVDTVAKPPEKFWLYLSRIARHVTEDDIIGLVKSCLQTDHPIAVRKLVRKDADLNQFAFISFKVGVDMELKDTALDPTVWPKGIFFREFENLQTTRDFWIPAKIPRIDIGTPSMTVPSPVSDVTPMQ